MRLSEIQAGQTLKLPVGSTTVYCTPTGHIEISGPLTMWMLKNPAWEVASEGVSVHLVSAQLQEMSANDTISKEAYEVLISSINKSRA